ncbi:MAG: alkaline phosphatase D family protein [Pseudomonadota bacterium]|nr:alkaline phosphatase D family protein [Pseudomonadota bacterium]
MRTDVFTWKEDRPWPNCRLKRGAIVGHTTPHSTKLWLRTGYPGDYQLLLFPINADSEALRQQLTEVPLKLEDLPDSVRRIPLKVENFDSDTTCVVTIDELEPSTEYGYALHGRDGAIERIVLGQDRPYQFRTLHDDPGASFSFGFYSCHMPYKDTMFRKTDIVNQSMWDYFDAALNRQHSRDLRFVIGGGDQVYTDGVDSLNIWRYLAKVARKQDGQLLPTKESMVTWYRDIYRGYWGFENLRQVHSRYPQYMIWDDHELGDGWGSYRLSGNQQDELNELFDYKKAGLTRDEALILIGEMKKAAFQVYDEYQHAHNPDTPQGQFDYDFRCGRAAFYCLDGRGQRDINRKSRRVLGIAQYQRFKRWLEARDPAETPFLFVISAVPIMHLATVLANADDTILADIADLQDDLRDSWEHKLHDSERKGLVKMLFAAANRGLKICILSGDVHTSAAFKMRDPSSGAIMYQLTSSAITYDKSRPLSWVLGKTVSDCGRSVDGYDFTQLTLYTACNFSIVQVFPEEQTVWFRLYGKQTVSDPKEEAADLPVNSALTNLELRF